ncbi:hypothetical protein [Streptomyces galbus]|uniref:hypothetical protein n=1 Tax=Streptomyces galbus TaxID=33898 RepID=UPI003EBF130C
MGPQRRHQTRAPADRRHPAAPEIEVTCSDIKRRGTSISGLHLDVVIRRDGHIAATGAATFNCTSPAVYRRLRAARIGQAAPAPCR